jgi:hypothetical protein
MEEGFVELAARESADVGAGSEDVVGAGDHDAADLGVLVEAGECGAELVHHLRGERVTRLRPVDPAEGDVPVDRRLDQRGHRI